MTAATDAAELLYLDHVLGTSSYTMPTQLYLALFTTPGPGETGTVANEIPSGRGYARQAINFDAAVSGSAGNAAAVTFPEATTSGWGSVSHWGLCEAGTRDIQDVRIFGAFDTAKTVDVGDTAEIADDTLTISLA